MHPIQISCISSNWHGIVVQTLAEIQEIDLIHFLFASDVEFCKDLASKYSVDFTANPKERVAFFRKRTPARLARLTGEKPKIFGSKF